MTCAENLILTESYTSHEGIGNLISTAYRWSSQCTPLAKLACSFFEDWIGFNYIKIGISAVFISYVKSQVHAKDSCLVIGSNIAGNVYLVSLAQHLSMTLSTVELLKSLYRSPLLGNQLAGSTFLNSI